MSSTVFSNCVVRMPTPCPATFTNPVMTPGCESPRESPRGPRETQQQTRGGQNAKRSHFCLLQTHAALAMTMVQLHKRGALANCSDWSTSGDGDKHDPTLPHNSRNHKMRRTTKCVQLVTEGRAKPSAMPYQMPKPICSNQWLQPETEA